MPEQKSVSDFINCRADGGKLDVATTDKLVDWLIKNKEGNPSLEISVIGREQVTVASANDTRRLVATLLDCESYVVCVSGTPTFEGTIRDIRTALEKRMGAESQENFNRQKLLFIYEDWIVIGRKAAGGEGCGMSDQPQVHNFDSPEEFLAAQHGFFDGLRQQNLFRSRYDDSMFHCSPETEWWIV